MILQRMFAGSEERSYVGPLTSAGAIELLSGGTRARSGETVTTKTALQVAPFWGGLSILSGDVSQFPLITYRRRPDRGKDRAVEHPTFGILRRYTGEMTSNLWLAIMVNQAIAYGTAYSRIHRTGNRNVARLEHFPHHRVELAYTTTDERVYKLKDRRGRYIETVPEEDMFRLMGLVFDVAEGLSLVEYARNTLGRIMAAEGYADEFYENAAEPRGWFEQTGEPMSFEAQKRFLANVERRHKGIGNRHKTSVLDVGMKWVPSGISPEDALLVDALHLGRKEVALFLNLPPHKLGDDSKVNYNSLEQENQSYLDSGLGVWLSRIEYEANEKLFPDRDKDTYFAEFLRDAKLRADTKTRYEVYSIARAAGIMSANECREKENMNPREDDGGDSYDNPNITVNSQQPDDETDNLRGGGSLVGWSIATRDVLCVALNRLVTRIVNDARKAAKRPDDFLSWLNVFEDNHRSVVYNECEPLARQVAVANHAHPERLAEQMCEWFFDIARDQLLRAAECDRDTLLDSVTASHTDMVAACRTLADELTRGEKDGT